MRYPVLSDPDAGTKIIFNFTKKNFILKNLSGNNGVSSEKAKNDLWMATILPEKLPKIAFPILIGIAILILFILAFYYGLKYFKSNQEEPEIAETNYENLELENFLASNGKQTCQMNGGPHMSSSRY